MSYNRRFYAIAHAILRPVLTRWWGIDVRGLQHVPKKGGFVVASNHLAYVDSFIIPLVFPRPVHFVSKDDFWKMGGWRGRVITWFFNTVGTIPLDREALSSGKGALDAGLQVLRDGSGFGIYPEGTRSKDGLLHAGKPGAAWLALESGCPVIPVGLEGTPELFKSSRLGKRGVVKVRVGVPITHHHLDTTKPTAVQRRELTAKIMDEIQALSGQQRA